MTIRDRTRPRTERPRKMLGTNPRSLDMAAPTAMAPVVATTPPPVLYPEPVAPIQRPLYPQPTTGVPQRPLQPETTIPVQPVPTVPASPTPQRPLFPSPPVPGTPPVTGTPPVPGTPPTAPVPGTIPPGYGLDFVRQPTPNELVENRLAGLLDQNSAYMENARRRGLEYANSRGNINSSIGAGASERAALEAALPIAQTDAQVYRDANAANFDAMSNLRQMRTAAQLEDWLSDSSFNREYNGRLALMPIQSSMDMMAFIAQRASEDPAVWTPDVMSGWMNFFNMWQGDMFSTLLGGGGDE